MAGDQIAISKEFSLTGEVYVRADGKKGKAMSVMLRVILSHVFTLFSKCGE